MAKILLIETSSEVCSAAISVDGEVIALSENLRAQSHAALLTLQIQECSDAAGIPLAQMDAIALSRGPGAYTALRVGASVAKGICYALDKPLIAVETLLALAHATRQITVDAISSEVQYPPSTIHRPSSTVFVPVLDARRQEVWFAVYDEDLQEISPAQPLILDEESIEQFVLKNKNLKEPTGIFLAGNGMEKIRNGRFSEKILFSEIKQSSARHLSVLAERYFQNADFQDIAYFEPFYMKPPNITTPANLLI